jgi:hypothetical protein
MRHYFQEFRALHSGPEIGKKWNRLIIFCPKQIFSNPIQDKGKMTQEIRF